MSPEPRLHGFFADRGQSTGVNIRESLQLERVGPGFAGFDSRDSIAGQPSFGRSSYVPLAQAQDEPAGLQFGRLLSQ